MTSKSALRARLLRTASAGLLLSAAVLVSPALAEAPTATAPSGTVSDVVVTATFRASNLQQTPIAITAVNAEMLAQRSQTDVSQVAAQAPNVTLKAAGGQGSSSMVAFIRGVGQTDFNYALEPGVGIYVDDVYYATLAGSLLDLLDVDRVEVLRGPQGTLAGKNSIGGAIKLFTKKPTGHGGYLQGTYGGYNRIEVRGAADFTLVEDKLFLRMSGASKHRDGYVTRLDYACTHPGSALPTLVVGNGCKLGTLGGVAYNAFKVALRWMPNEDIEVNLSADAVNDQSEAVANTLLHADPRAAVTVNGVPYDSRFVPYGPQTGDPLIHDPFVTYATFLDPGFPGFTINGNNLDPYTPVAFTPLNTFKAWGLSGTIDWRISPTMSLKFIAATRYYNNEFSDDTDGSPIPIEQLYQRLQHREYSEELRLNGSLLESKVDYTLGGFNHTQNGTLRARVDLPYVGASVPPFCGGRPRCYGPLNFVHGPDTTPSATRALFAHTTIHLTDALNISGGVRTSWEHKTYTYARHNPDGTVPVPCLPGTPFNIANAPNCSLFGLNGSSARFPGPTGDAHRWDWRADIDYHITRDIMVYAQYSTGYKGGGVNPRPFYISQELTFGPETLTAYEGGIKTQLFDHRMRFNAAGFFNKYNDIILTLSSCPIAGPSFAAPCALPANVGSADVKGLEFETEIHPIPGMMIDGSLSYIDFKYTHVDPITGVRPDMTTPYTPKWKWSFGIQHEFQVGDAGSLTPRLDGAYQSDIFTSAINCGPPLAAAPPAAAVCQGTGGETNHIKGYTTFNGRLTWRSMDGDWSVSAEVTNLTNKLYYTVLFDSTASAGYEAATPGMPRTWGITVKKIF
jgi:iron complex outermembrane receptor protein